MFINRDIGHVQEVTADGKQAGGNNIIVAGDGSMVIGGDRQLQKMIYFLSILQEVIINCMIEKR